MDVYEGKFFIYVLVCFSYATVSFIIMFLQIYMTGNGHIEHLKVTKYNIQPSEAR